MLPLILTRALDVVQGVEENEHPDNDLGDARRRDPDALPPESIFELLMSWVHRGYTEFFSGNSLFALKAAVLTSKWLLQSLLCSLLTSFV